MTNAPLPSPDPRTLDTLPLPDARALQEQLRSRVIERDEIGPLRRIAGADVSYDRRSPVMYAAVVVVDARTGEVIERASAVRRVRFPYVPGFLSFRELPPLAEAFARLSAPPDVVLCDGHGRAHPRRFGLACHLGVALDLPAIGCAKSRLVGTHREPGLRRGSRTALRDGRETIGAVLRTRDGVKPIFVSIGHRVSLDGAVRIVLASCRGHRVPEPVRAAHEEVNRLRREAKGVSLE